MGLPWGIDFGNANCVMAGSKRAHLALVDHSNAFCLILHPVARRGGIDTICNEASQRQTACMVSFVDRERFVGEGARTKAQTNVKVCSAFGVCIAAK
jgi:molecular chaperone DnaK (HSP70)